MREGILRGTKLMICGLFCLLAAQGCEKSVPKDQLGTVVFELPTVPGGDHRPPTPGIDDLAPAPEKASEK